MLSKTKPDWYWDLTPEERAAWDELNEGEGFLAEGETVALVVRRPPPTKRDPES